MATEPDVPPQGIDPAEAFDVVNTLTDGLAGLIASIAGWTQTYFQERIVKWAEVPLSSVLEFLREYVNFLRNRSIASFNVIKQALADTIESVVGSSSQFFTGLINGLIDGVVSVSQYVADGIASILSAIWGQASDFLSSVGDFLAPIVEPIYAVVDSIIGTGADVLSSLGGFFSDVSGSIASGIDDLYINLLEPVTLRINEVLAYVQEVVALFIEFIPQIPDKLIELRERALVFFRDDFLPLAEQYGTDQWAIFAELFTQYLGGASDAVQADLRQAAQVSGLDGVSRVLNDLTQATGFGGNRLIRAALYAFAMVPILTGTIGAVAAPDIEAAIQANQEIKPVKILQLPELAEAAQRGLLNGQDYYALAKRNGYDFEQAGSALDLRKQLIPPGELISWWRRGFMSRQDMSTALVHQGYKLEDAERILQASDLLPPVEDMIRFAVREVYSPDIATQFGLAQGFPPEFAQQAAKHGLSRETAQQYWMAHWVLPSVNMFFEMYQRDVIEYPQLETGLRALDIMPFFRDKLTEISYNVLTRVDIRRIHALGLFNHDDLVKRLRHGGYSPEDAALMATFYEKYNEDVSTLGKEPERDLTRAQIISAYKDGLLSPADSMELLTALGYSEEDADVIMIGADIDIETAIRKEERNAVVELAANGDITFEAAQERLGAAGFTPEEIALAVNEIIRKQRTRIRTPELAQLDTMLKSGILEDQVYMQGLRALGYSEFWVAKLGELQGIKER